MTFSLQASPKSRQLAEPRVSVVVATKNRATELRSLAAALTGQSLAPEAFEVVFVDDGSTDETASVLDDLCRSVRFAARTISLPVSRGPATARNEGWRAARASSIAFTDDDCRPERGWLEHGTVALERGDGVVMGCTRADREAPGYGEPFSRTMEVDREDGRYPTCNVFYRRAALEAVGGFDEGFRFACGEDTDLAWRVKNAGWTSSYEPGAIVVHAVRPPDFLLFLFERRRFADQVLVLKRHPNLRTLFYRRWWYKRSHVHAVATVGLILSALAVGPLALGLLPIVWWDRWRVVDFGHAPVVRTGLRFLVADLWELVVFCYASARYRKLLV